MQVQQLIKASAEVITITSFKPGDVYKRVETAYSGDATMKFGIVQDVLNNGEDSALTALEYNSDYNSGLVVAQKVWDGSKPAALFPATPDEIASHMDELVKAVDDKVRRVRKELEDASRAQDLAYGIRARVANQELTAPQVVRGELAELAVVPPAPDGDEG